MARPSRALDFMSGRTAVFSLDVWRALDFMSGLNAQFKSIVAVALAQISEAASSYPPGGGTVYNILTCYNEGSASPGGASGLGCCISRAGAFSIFA